MNDFFRDKTFSKTGLKVCQNFHLRPKSAFNLNRQKKNQEKESYILKGDVQKWLAKHKKRKQKNYQPFRLQSGRIFELKRQKRTLNYNIDKEKPVKTLINYYKQSKDLDFKSKIMQNKENFEKPFTQKPNEQYNHKVFIDFDKQLLKDTEKIKKKSFILEYDLNPNKPIQSKIKNVVFSHKKVQTLLKNSFTNNYGVSLGQKNQQTSKHISVPNLRKQTGRNIYYQKYEYRNIDYRENNFIRKHIPQVKFDDTSLIQESSQLVSDSYSNLNPYLNFEENMKKIESKNSDSNLIDKDQLKCNPRLFELFGIQDLKQKIIVVDNKQNKDIKNICPQIDISCCDKSDFKKISQNFVIEAQNLRQSFEIVEETLSLIRGPKLQYILDRSNQTNKCDEIIKKLIGIQDKQQDFRKFKQQRIQYMFEELEYVLSELPLFVENLIQLYGNVSCSICNPDENRHIKVISEKANQQGIKNYQMFVKLRFSNCLEIIQVKKFLLRLEYLTVKYLRQFANVSACLLDNQQYSFINDQNTPNKLYHEIQHLDSCILGFYKPMCLKVCSLDSVLTFEVSQNFFQKQKEVLYVLYKIFTDKNVEDYYLKVKGKDFQEVGLQEVFHFYRPHDKNINAVESFSLGQTSGVSITNDQIGQMFLRKALILSQIFTTFYILIF